MNIVKQSTGNVVLTDNSGNIQKVFVNVNALEVKSSDEVIVKYGFNQWHSLFASQIDNTQVEPAAAVPFSGNVYDLVALLSSSFFFELSGGVAADLATVLGIGNTSGANDIRFNLGQGLLFDNSSRLKEGTTDGGLGGNKGIAQLCSIGYELKWEAGRLYVMEQDGFTIRSVMFQFNISPVATDDNTKGYIVGSRWVLDNGDVYICTDSTTGAAIWSLQSNAVPTLSQVLLSGNSAGNSIIDLKYLDFEVTAGHIVTEGHLTWNTSAGTLDLGLKGGNTTLNVGQQLITRVVNKTTPLVPLTKAGYQVVIVAGATGQRLSVKLAKADSDINSAGTLGIVCENIAVNQEGFIVCDGPLTDINTTGSLQGETWADGDLLYLSPTTFGAITNVKPSAPFHEVRVGYVEYSHINKGKIFVKIDNGYELDELHNVDINTGTLANNDGLFYNNATSTWQNKTVTTALGYTPVTNARTITINGSAQNLTADRTFTVTDANLSTSDITTNDVSTTKHGFAPKAPNNTSQFLRGDGTWAAPVITDPAGWTYIVLSANQDVTNTITPQDITELQFSVVAGGHYMVEMDLCWSGNNATGDYQGNFLVTSGVMKSYGMLIVSDQTTQRLITCNNQNTAQLGSFNLVSLDIDFLMTGKINYNFHCSQNATFKYQVRNVAASAGAISRTWKGSILKYKRID